MTVNSLIIRHEILEPLWLKMIKGDFTIVRGEKTVEIMNFKCTFSPDDKGIINIDDIFKTSEKYVEREMEWYLSQNPNGTEIAKHAQIWSTASDENMMTNSNYGYLMFSPQNGYQFNNVVEILKKDPKSRRAIAYYTNPMMHFIGGNDHVCTMYVSYTERKGRLNAYVSMRSNDVRFGLIGADLSWQIYMLERVAEEVGLEIGTVNWHVISLHLYERHFVQLAQIIEGKLDA